MTKIKKRIIYLVLLFPTLIFYSCGGSGEVTQMKIEKSQAYENTKEEIWSAIISIFGDLNFPIKTLEKASWLLQSDYVNITPDDIYKYTSTEGGEYISGTMSFTIYLKDVKDTRVNVTISSDFTGHWQTTKLISGRVINEGNQRLYSNGKYEKIIFEKIRALLIK